MKREIKFRVWSKKHSQWMNHCAVIDCNGNIGSRFIEVKPNQEIVEHIVNLSPDENIIQLFTGLLDKNNKPIYEGDIVEYNSKCDITYSKPGIVSIGEYFNGGGTDKIYHYGVRVKRLDMKDCYFGLNEKDKNYLIIGNIFQNPEL